MTTRPDYGTVLHLDDIRWASGQLDIAWGVDGLSFTTTLWYATVDFDELAVRHGVDVVRTVAFHVAMFEINKGVSFRPAVLRIAPPWQPLLTAELYDLWRRVVHGVWAQWRFEHDLPGYAGPEPEQPLATASGPLGAELPATDIRSLWFCGGGKDSVLAGHLLDTIGHAYDGLAYSHSVYGLSRPQLDLIGGVLAGSHARRHHHLFVYDTAMDLPLDELRPYAQVQYVLAAETPASLFAALPLCLAHGFQWLVLAHERSANVGNLRWDATGEDVNHQWGKSLAAEALLDDYLEGTLGIGVRYFSVLQPVYDPLIFASLRPIADRLRAAHSCNIAKPWCMRCPKCAYVWLSYKAWLPWEPVDDAFGGANLLDFAENQAWFREMLGLETHTPFECIGQVDEVRLAFALARARGLTGTAMAHFDEVAGADYDGILRDALSVADRVHRIPAPLAESVVAFFHERAEAAREYAESTLAVRL